MFTSFLSFLILSICSLVVIYLFLYVFTRIIFNKYNETMNSLCLLQNDLCCIKEELQKVLDELGKNSKTKILNKEEDEREERWEKIRKAFSIKEKE